MLKLDEEFRSVLKRFKFRWKQVISQAGGSRVMVMGTDRPAEYPIDKIVTNPFKIKLATCFTVVDKMVEDSELPGDIDNTQSFFLTPNVFIQPLIFQGKDEADEARFSNDNHESKPLQLITHYVDEVCKQLEFNGFPITKGANSTNLEEIKTFTDEHDIVVTPEKEVDEAEYAVGVLNVETRMTAFDHCALQDGTEYMRIKDKDLSMASHPLFPDGIIYVPLTDSDIGCFIFKMTKDVNIETIKDFNDFARDIID